MTLYKLAYFVPESHLEVTKAAIFAAGAGRMGNYDHCCWQVLGQGQFRPLSGSQAFIGQQDLLEALPEYRVECVCVEALLPSIIHALTCTHPYEEPAIDVWPLCDWRQYQSSTQVDNG